MSDGPLSPEEVAHRGFPTSFRGFDTGEVRAYLQRVANELKESTARERDLNRRLADAEHRAAHPVIQGEALTRLLGEEMGRILASAQEAAGDLKARAEENAARILREAHEQAQRIRATAEGVLAERTEEAEGEAAEIRRIAAAEAASVVDRARRDAAEAASQAEARAREAVEEAQAVRARVLGELARRKRLLQMQVETLRAGRERLLDAYRLVRRSVDEVADELQRAETEARAAATAAGDRAAAGADVDVDVEGAREGVVEPPEATPAASPPAPTVGPAAPGAGPGAAAPGAAARGAGPAAPGPAAPGAGGAGRAGPGSEDAGAAEVAAAPAAGRAQEASAALAAGAEPAGLGGTEPAGRPAGTEPAGRAAGTEPAGRPAGTEPGAPHPAGAAGAAWAARAAGGAPGPPASASGAAGSAPGPASGGGAAGEGPASGGDDLPRPPQLRLVRPGDGERVPPGPPGDDGVRVIVTRPGAAAPTAPPAAEPPAAAAPPPGAPTHAEPNVPAAEKGATRPSLPPEPAVPPADASAAGPTDVPAAEEGATRPSLPPEPGVPPGDGDADPATPAPAAPGVEELFARIRAGRADAVAKAQEVLGAEPSEAPAPEPTGARAAERAEGSSAAGEEALLERRDAAVEGIQARLARKLKRALQDEQNEVLDRLRSRRSAAGADDLLPPASEQADRYVRAAEELVRAAAAAGAAFASPGADARPRVDDVVRELAASIAEPLRRALERAVRSDSGAGDPSALVERIGAVYRECKGQRLEGLSGDAITAAFSRGALAGLGPGRASRWVVDDDGRPCPDCDDNALAGPTPPGEAFPTGQHHPPAHAGCRCLLAPAEVAAAVNGTG